MKKAAVFNDLSGFGKCSLTAAIPVLSAQGVQCCPMASAVLTNQTGYEYHKCTDLTAMIKDYIDNWQKNNAHFDGIYSSTLQRARRTAELVAKPHGLQVHAYDELREINFGVWEGHTYKEITEQWPGEIEAFYDSDGKLPAHGGESFLEVEQRITAKTKEILSHHKDGDTVLIASHGASIRCLLFGLLGLDLRRIWCFQQYNTAFNIIDYYGVRRNSQ